MRYEFWDAEENRLITWEELQDEKYVVRASKDGFYLTDTSREDEDGYDFEIIGEWQEVGVLPQTIEPTAPAQADTDPLPFEPTKQELEESK